MAKGMLCPNGKLCPGQVDGVPPPMKVKREKEEKMGYWVWYWCPHDDMEVKEFEGKSDWLIKMQEVSGEWK